jgi:4-hydroxy-tetrahydrodipicolinate reductase
MKKKGVLLVGKDGRMGKEISRLLLENSEFKLTCGANSKTDWKKLGATGIDVVIDFSLPEGMTAALAWSEKNKKPYICGVTGLSTKERNKLKASAEKIPVFYSSNMSFGVAVLKKALEDLTPLTDFDIVIEETHHRHKKDKPSGTALTLIDAVEKSQKRKPNEIHAIRGGGVIGKHSVHFMSEMEVFTLEHQALDRAVFAKGALMAAKWMLRQPAGYYGMKNLLG